MFPNAFQVAALVVGLMADRTTLGGSPPDRGELLEVQDLVRAGGRLLLGGRRSRDWTRTHHATDAAEAAAEMMEEILRHGGLGKYPDDQLATLQNLLAAAADGVHVLVGNYPHTGEAEGVSAAATHPADVIALATGGRETTTRQHAAGGPQAIHVYRAKRKLRQLQPFLTGEMQAMVNIAVMHLHQWTTEHWGDEVELVEDSAPEQPEPQEGVASETAGGEEMKEGEEPDEEDLEEAEEPEELEEPRSRTSVEAPNFLSETFQEVQTRSEGQSAQIAEAQAAAEDMERGDDTENEKGKEQESTDEEAGGDAEVAEDAETAKPPVLAEVPETPEQAGSSTAMSGEHQNPDHEENEDIRSRMHLEGSHDDTGLHAEEQKDKDSPTSSHSSCPSKQSGRGLPPSFVESKPDESPVCSETESIQPKTAMPYISRDNSRPASASSPSGTVRHELEKTYSLENEALSTTAGHAANVPGPSPRGEAPCKETSSKCEKIQKTRKPPLPHDALRAQAKSITSRANELEYVGLDPKLVETGAIRKYHEVFQNFTDIFSWGRSQEVVPQRERYLRESLQLFSQFCNIIGSLEVQFATKFGPADHSTPNATHQALNAMASRGAGLYGVFLKGIIDKMDADACTVPRPLPVETDVYSLRYYKVVQNRTEVYDIVTRVFHRKDGWEELPHGLGLSNAWNLCWTWSKPKLDYSRLCVWQKVNHFPENKHLTRKDFLKRCIDRYTRTGGKLGQYFNICPKTFVLPKEYCLFIECFTKIAEENGDLEGSLTCHSDYKGIPHDPVAATLATSALEAYEESFGYLVLPDGFGTGSKKPGEAPLGAEGLDGSAGPAGPAGRKFADYRMEAAPKWDGEKPEEQYREYARALRLWLIEARERLPESLIGKRILDSIPYGSRLSSVLAHLSVEEITAPDGWKRVVACIEEAHGYLKVAKLEQAFNAAIFGGRRKQVRVLTNGAIDFRLVETAIRKIFNDTLDAVPDGKKSYWWDEYEGEDWSEETDVYYGDMPAEPYLFDELMEMEADGEIYLCLEGPLPAILEESEAVEYAGDLMSYVYGETADRWQAKSKGKGKKGKGKGKGRGKILEKVIVASVSTGPMPITGRPFKMPERLVDLPVAGGSLVTRMPTKTRQPPSVPTPRRTSPAPRGRATQVEYLG
ncbi:Ttll5 [Symbiodinium necroappetens]|uniref:Ttll5 protein n=1 Tax=Symbiodinium necroappetens TaxID=1628268 RepID=A0A813C4X1_9DINO|nr:Ttll5 [Symbiodinium necroappetens]